jgi:hypothetical protein
MLTTFNVTVETNDMSIQALQDLATAVHTKVSELRQLHNVEVTYTVRGHVDTDGKRNLGLTG